MRIDIVTTPVVTYNYGSLASHLLGYCGKITQSELEKNQGYAENDLIGKTGIQYVFEKYLRGKKVKTMPLKSFASDLEYFLIGNKE